MPADTINISRLIDERPLSGLQKRVIALCGFVVLVEGFGTQLPGFVAPALANTFSLSAADLSVFFAIGLVGLMLGALIVSPLADRIGRRWVILVSVFVFGLSSLATAASPSIVVLDLLRFVAGVGIGGALPTAVALTCEYSPHKRRSLMVVVMFNGFILGALTVGLLSARLVPTLGWQSIFIIAGMVAMFLVPILEAALPESPRFLAAREDRRVETVSLLLHLDPTLQIGEHTRLVSNEEVTRDKSVAALFREGRTRTTLLLWVISFMSLLDLFLVAYWLPTEVRALGAPVGLALLVGALFQVGGLTGTVFGWMADRFGAGAGLSCAYLFGAICVAGVGFAGSSLPLVMLAVFGAGSGILGGQTTSNAVTAIAYPTDIRSTGVGWATGLGRVGSIIGPLLAGGLVAMSVPPQYIFYVAAVPALCAAAASACLRPMHTQLMATKEAAAE